MDNENKIANFIKYNNAVPIILGILFFSTSATLAASPEVRDSFYATGTELRSIDNSYLLSTNLETYDFSMKVTRITEDKEWYYLDYDLRTIDIVDGAWGAVTFQKVLRVSKALLRDGDLRAYAEIELAQVRDQEQRLLAEAKEREKGNGLSQKVVATVHTGLVGRFIRPTEATAPFYQPSPEEQEKNDPLRVIKPTALVTWDANAKPEPPEPQEDPAPRDYCPEMEGMQESQGLCPVIVPPAEDPPIEEPPVEASPTEEPVEPAPLPEPAPEPAPQEEGTVTPPGTPAP